MKTKQIVFLGKELLEHHPDNPRKEIGDISELTASIAKDGILQNLTVVRNPNKETESYYIVIGNRRFEAGLAAGLDEFPCVISDMDYNKQLETMLVENINRSDLTVLEEAEGFKQLTLAGFTVEDISESTGFSETTIRRRLKISEYDKKKTRSAIERGGHLEEFVKLEKIKSSSKKDELIDYIGTPDFNLNYIRAVKDETIEINKEKVLAFLEGKATEIDGNATWNSGYDGDYSVKQIRLDEDVNLQNISLPEDHEVFFHIWTDKVVFYKKRSSGSVKVEKTELQRDAERNYRQLNRLAKDFFELRQNYILSLAKTRRKKAYQDICLYAIIRAACLGSLKQISAIDLLNKAGYNYDWRTPDENLKALDGILESQRSGSFITVVYKALNDSKDNRYHTEAKNEQFSEPTRNKSLDVIYEFLLSLGYEMSDEEKLYMNGTHELFVNEPDF